MGNSDDNKKSDLRVGYQVATQLMTYEGQLQWRMTAIFIPFGALIFGAAILPSFVGLTDPRVIAAVATVFSIVGIATSFMWWSMVTRSRKYYTYWIASARELEKLLHPEVKTLSRGQRLTYKQNVDGEDLVFVGRERIKVGTNLNIFYLTFMLTFGLLLIWNVVRLVRAF